MQEGTKVVRVEILGPIVVIQVILWSQSFGFTISHLICILTQMCLVSVNYISTVSCPFVAC